MEKTLKVTGMHCKSCEMLLNDSLSEIKGVEKVSADSQKGTVTLKYSDESIIESVKNTIKKEGYTVV